MRKRVLSVLMTLCMVLTLLPVSALAAETKNPIVSTIEKFDEVYNGGRGTFRATESGNTVTISGSITLRKNDFIVLDGQAADRIVWQASVRGNSGVTIQYGSPDITVSG